jgi:hypothetical protein
MTKRAEIKKIIKNSGLTLESAIYERNMDYAYGDSWDASEWIVKIKEFESEIQEYHEDIIKVLKAEIKLFKRIQFSKIQDKTISEVKQI